MTHFAAVADSFKALNWRGASGRDFSIEASDDPQSPVLSAFFEGYDEAFILPNEKEDVAGFKECFALNYGAAYAGLSSRYGPFREIALIMRDAGGVIGGANFIAFPLPLAEPILSVNLNYIYVRAERRRQGNLAHMLGGVGATARAFFDAQAASLPLLVFIEQNDPFRMSSQDYERDTDHSGLDQMRRIEIWAKLGARVVDFAYIQPPLSPEQQADPNLVFAALDAEGEALDACLLLEHLKRFFGISVLKGADLASDATASSQLRMLGESCSRNLKIPLLQMRNLSSNTLEIRANLHANEGLRALLRA